MFHDIFIRIQLSSGNLEPGVTEKAGLAAAPGVEPASARTWEGGGINGQRRVASARFRPCLVFREERGGHGTLLLPWKRGLISHSPRRRLCTEMSFMWEWSGGGKMKALTHTPHNPQPFRYFLKAGFCQGAMTNQLSPFLLRWTADVKPFFLTQQRRADYSEKIRKGGLLCDQKLNISLESAQWKELIQFAEITFKNCATPLRILKIIMLLLNNLLQGIDVSRH